MCKKLARESAKPRAMWQISPPAESKKLLTAIAPLFPVGNPASNCRFPSPAIAQGSI
jgi:hypothetical protein